MTAAPDGDTRAMAAAEDGIEMVCFQAGNHRCAIEARLVLGSRAAPAGAAGAAAPAVEARFGLPEAPAGPRQVLMLRQPAGSEFAVGPAIELRRFAFAAIHPLPPLIAARCAVRGLKGLAIEGRDLVLLVDPGT
jgi:hypothetical protein